MPDPIPTHESLVQRTLQGQRDLAMRNQRWALWKFTNDTSEINDGPHPVGERMGAVWGFDGAAETARLLMVQDDTISFMKLVPSQPNERLKVGDVYVRRRVIVGSGRAPLDPNSGRMFPVQPRIQKDK